MRCQNGISFTKKTFLQFSSMTIKRVKSTKHLGVNFNENLKWDDHVNEISNTLYQKYCYTIRTLRYLKRLSDFHLRKKLADFLILPKVSFVITIYGIYLEQYHCKSLQELINSTTGFVCNRCVNVNDVIKLKCLPFVQRVSFCSSNFAFKIVNDNMLVD